jgi:hypothetical protein
MVWKSTWTPEQDAELLRLRDVERMGIAGVARILGKSKSCCSRRHRELRRLDGRAIVVEPVPALVAAAPEPLHRQLGIKTHTHRQVILNDPHIRCFDEVSGTFSHNHLYRAEITLAGDAR